MAAVNVTNGFGNASKEEQGLSDAGGNVALKATRSITTMAAHILVGIVVGANLLFATRFGMPTTPVNQHIVLCVIGFTLMMGESILALAPDSWLSTLKLKHKRLIHWVMQVVGSLLAIIGCIIMSLSKTIHWNTLHGQFALVAMVFTTVSLVNGLASLYAYEWRRVLPGILSKLTHICFGIVAFAAASISLAYGMDKNSFRNNVTTRFADSLIIMTAALTVIIIINPFLTFYNKFKAAVTKYPVTHICFGIVAFTAASISLAYGMDKGSFRNNVTTRFADSLIIMTAALTVIIIINPFLTFFNKFKTAVTK